MKIQRRVSGEARPDSAAYFAELGIKIEDKGFFGFWMDEDDPNWPEARRWLGRGSDNSIYFSRTVFTDAEMDEAR